ncbi:MAG: SGNH/GDSL hydrolase family protein [Acidobacteriota bacterium]|nr:SGNH/GDSL hydrolase family protein [Acidobacteriota bacterium]
MRITRRVLFVISAVLFAFPGVAAWSQAYTSVVIFGDSLSDTGNDATVSAAKNTVNAQVPGPASNYALGRFTDDSNTVPAARNFMGVWIEQVAAKLAAKPVVLNSLAGGTNYAYGFATTDVGTSLFTYGPGNALSFTVNNMGQQVTDYLATNPVITSQTLFVVWGGANDLQNATSAAAIGAAAVREAGLVQRLVSAGATDIIVPNLPPLGLIPRFNGSSAAALQATQAAQGFDQSLAQALAGLPAANPGVTLHVFQLDTFTLFNTIVGPPIMAPLANVTMSSQGMSAVNPDTFLFWDDLHPTTVGHSLLAAAALTLIGTPVTTTTAVTSSNLAANLNSSITLTASVTGTSGTPTGNVTFLDGTTPLGTALTNGSTTTATATLTTSALTAGTHSITAVFTGVNGYVSSTSAGISEVVTAPAFTSSLTPTSLTILSGQAGNTTITASPVGGFSGTATFACGTVPAHFACTFAPASLALSGNNAQQTTVLTIGTSNLTSLTMPARPGARELPEIFSALAVFPCLGLLSVAAFRRRKLLGRNVRLLAVLTMLAAGAVVGLTGCAGSYTPPNHNAAPGTYVVPVMVTAGATTTTLNLTVVVQ